jgi:tripartite-type tricarboxylate transporter receptor subunit TctC
LGIFAIVAVLAAFMEVATPPEAAAYPERPIRMIIPLPPGGALDVVARLMQPHLEKSLGKPVIIEHRPGASGIVGAGAVAGAEPDGHTLLLVPTTFTINAATRPSLQSMRSLEPVIIVGRNSLMFLVNPKVKASTLEEFAALAKAEPGKFNYATPRVSSQAHLLLELWSGQAGIRMQHVPYRGGAPAVLATVTGETQITLISPTASLARIESGALRALATGGTAREEQLPDVPTAAEAGYPDFKALQWIGLLVTGGTPKPIIDRLNREVQTILQRADMKTELAKQGMTIGGGTSEEFRLLIEDEIRQWAEVASKANIRIE